MAEQDNARTSASERLLPALAAQAPGRAGGDIAAPASRKALGGVGPEQHGRPVGGNREGQWAKRRRQESQSPAGPTPEPPNWSNCMLNRAIGPNGGPVHIPPGWRCPLSPCCGMGSLMGVLEAVAGETRPQ